MQSGFHKCTLGVFANSEIWVSCIGKPGVHNESIAGVTQAESLFVVTHPCDFHAWPFNVVSPTFVVHCTPRHIAAHVESKQDQTRQHAIGCSLCLRRSLFPRSAMCFKREGGRRHGLSCQVGVGVLDFSPIQLGAPCRCGFVNGFAEKELPFSCNAQNNNKHYYVECR